MTAPTDHSHDDLHNEDVAHEHSDISVKGIALFLIGLTVVAIVTHVAMYGVFVGLEGQAVKNDPVLSPLAPQGGQLPPQPRLLTDEVSVMDAFRERQNEALGGYAWVDQATGVARIPIEEAKKLIVERGLPTRADAAADPLLGTHAPSMADASSGRTAAQTADGTAGPERPEAYQPASHSPGALPKAGAPR